MHGRRIGGGLLLAGIALAGGFVASFRAGFDPVLTAVRRFNRAVTNPRQLTRAGQPGSRASVVHHAGRTTGTPYRTPVSAVPTPDGFLVALPYGPGADWVRNVRAAGGATVEHEGRTVRVHRPALVGPAEAAPFLSRGDRWVHRLFGVGTFLRVRTAEVRP
ncbi:nitroreductase family deazaflavin-dependent oxidoreductase [Geodermatophilus sp. SYSU D00758]